ncbi:MAG: alanine racemase, partial [Campylobacterales bacterium]|nr:alanine racemase [Campylobacterales bacterium]
MAFITLNRKHFYHNLNQIALKTGSVEKIAIVLKDNAYGHGIEEMAGLAKEFGIKHAVVKNNKEADRIKSLFESVLILGGTFKADEVCSFAVNALDQIGRIPQNVKVELKVDTGMHRNGIMMHELDLALELITQKRLQLIGVMTHYRSADVLSSELFWQQKNFEIVKGKVRGAGFENVRFHSHNSATILRMHHFDEDMVRVGIGAYGYNELPKTYDEIELKPVLSLYASKVASRMLGRGERVGYAGDFEAPQKMIVSTYDLGYGDGWCRGDSSDPYVTAEGLPILGRVSMDLISLASDKEEVCIMDDAQKAARHFKTISYEMT